MQVAVVGAGIIGLAVAHRLAGQGHDVTVIAPDEATYPRAFENTALAFLVFSGIYLMISLTASILREQITS